MISRVSPPPFFHGMLRYSIAGKVRIAVRARPLPASLTNDCLAPVWVDTGKDRVWRERPQSNERFHMSWERRLSPADVQVDSNTTAGGAIDPSASVRAGRWADACVS